ncbi:MAG: class I SAM-dependent methyltransferase [Methylococcaceae bacterium]
MHKQPKDHAPSSFVLDCLTNQIIGGQVLDLACGYGRHTHLLKSKGYSVVSGDLSIDGLQVIKLDMENSFCVQLNASVDLPFLDNSFNLVVVVHYVHKGLLSRLSRLITPGGFLIYETYGGQGENWLSLPVQGELEDELVPNFSILKSRKSYVGPKDDQHVNLKLFARKNHA